MKKHSLSKSRSLFKWFNNRYQKKYKDLPINQKTKIENLLERLDAALINKDRDEASKISYQLEEFEKPLAKSFFEQIFEFVSVVIIAVLVATILRQTVFEAYEIPTGSMRPTFKEQDDVVVSKTAFGINMPFSTDHIDFDPSLVKRGGIVVFSGDGIDLNDTDSHYLWVFPYKKRYTKRLMGKPGDTVYFYGGKVYGMDSDGNALKELYDSPWNEKISYTPYVYMEGIVRRSKKNEFTHQQMHEDIAKTELLSYNRTLGQVFDGQEWVKDNVEALKKPHSRIETYSDFWGFKNYALSRILTKSQAKMQKDLTLPKDEDAVLYLQLRHTPHLNSETALFMQDSSGIIPVINAFTTLIPLNKKHVDAIMNNLYTARFVVKDGKATRYSFDKTPSFSYGPSFPNVPDGTYEFYYGTAYEIGLGSISTELPKDHPLYSRDPEHVQKLYNFGIDFNVIFEPNAKNITSYASRYTFFKDGDLITMNGVILEKDDPTLIAFNASEKEKQEKVEGNPYVAFQDYGAPLNEDGSIKKEFMETFGLKIKEGHYLTLGDNYAMSADSRIFGFVPEANLQGAPVFLIWPTGSRWGIPPQNAYKWLSFPTVFIWSTIALIGLIWWVYLTVKKSKPNFKKMG